MAGIDFAHFSESWEKCRAVERGLEIVSEASRGLSETIRAAHPDVP